MRVCIYESSVYDHQGLSGCLVLIHFAPTPVSPNKIKVAGYKQPPSYLSYAQGECSTYLGSISAIHIDDPTMWR